MSEGRRLEKEVVLSATPEEVWEAIATGPGITAWFGLMPIEPRVGAESPFGSVTAWEPRRRFAARGAEAEDGSTEAFEFLIEAREGGGTVLRFVHSGFHGDNWETEYEFASRGWAMYFHTLDQYLTYFPSRAATFIEAEGPQASAQEKAWTVLLRGLGLTGNVKPGDQVRLTPDGLAPIEGVVDYVFPEGVVDHATPRFLGVRTTDGLYRFHGRAGLGCSVAVGHHIYSANVDGGEAQIAWHSWLDRLFAG